MRIADRTSMPIRDRPERNTQMTRKSIDTLILSVGTDKPSQREWDWMQMLKPMAPSPVMVASSIL